MLHTMLRVGIDCASLMLDILRLRMTSAYCGKSACVFICDFSK